MVALAPLIALPISRQQPQSLALHAQSLYKATGTRPGAIPLNNILKNTFFTTNVSIAGQSLRLCLDTGSGDTWFRGKNCRSSDGSCASNLPYLDSTSLTPTKRSFSKRYGSGQVGAYIYYGDLSLGPYTANIPIGVAVSLSGFNDGYEDGLMGLSNNLGQISASLGGLVDSKFMNAIAAPMFSFYLSNDGEGNGELTIGGVNDSRYKGEISYYPAAPNSTWDIDIQGATGTVGNVVIDLAGGKTRAFPDTGCTLMIMDTKPADALNNALGSPGYDESNGLYPLDCGLTKNVDIKIGKTTFTVSPEEYLFRDGNTCYSGFTKGADKAGFVVLGDTFLRAVVSVYDRVNNRVGFATAIHKNE